MAALHTYGGSIVMELTIAETRQHVICGLETSRCPRTVLCKEAAES
jgi:hypothetical protein